MIRQNFKDKNVLITGASSGIGYNLSLELASRGANLILIARREHRLQELAQKIKKNDRKVLIIVGDVREKNDFQKVITRAHHEIGQIDIAVANAAIPTNGNFEDLTTDAYRRIFATNVFGVLNTTYACLNDLKNTKGTLVIIGSTMAYLATPGTSAYSMSKFAVRAFAETVRNELFEHEIKVILLNPGFVESEMRQIDNDGILDPERKDWAPSILVMSAQKAARKMAKAIYRKKREKFIGFNGYIGYWFRQYAPWLYFALLSTGNRIIRSLGKN